MLVRYKYSDLSLIFNVLWVLIFCVYLLFWQVIYAVHQDLFKSDLASDFTVVSASFTDILWQVFRLSIRLLLLVLFRLPT